jgi:hypothetical protein
VPRSVDAVVHRALVRDPQGRFQTASDFLDALEAAIALAPPREVGAYLELKCKDRLEERRARLKSIIEGRDEPLSMHLLPEVTTGSNDSTNVPPALMKKRQVQSGETESQISQIAASIRDASIPPPRKMQIWMGLGAAFLTVCFGGLAVWFALHTIGARRVAATRAADTATATAATATATAANDPDVSLVTVHADTPILGVRAPGAKRVEIVGNDATLYVAPWTGALQIDAVLEGGKRAHASIEPGGANDVVLVPAPAQGAPGARPGGKGPRTPPQPAGASTAKKNELQDNPY